MSETISDFREKLKTTTAIKCNKPNALHGDFVYHVLAIYDDEEVAVKYFGKHKRWWHYTFFPIDGLFYYYLNGWIELRGEE
jgi:hypothetical protein